MLKTRGIELKGKKVLISGAGNVAQYTAEKVLQLGGIPMTMSDSDGYIYDPDGIDREKLDFIMELKNIQRGRIKEYADEYPNAKYVPGKKPWFETGCEIALPSATQNEINEEAAKALVANGVIAVSEVPTCLPLLRLSKCSRTRRFSMLRARLQMPAACLFQVSRCHRTPAVSHGLPRRLTTSSTGLWRTSTRTA